MTIMSMRLLVLVYITIFSCLVSYTPASPTQAPNVYVADVLSLSSDTKMLLHSWLVNIYFSSNGPAGVYQNDGGHVKLIISANVTNSINLNDKYSGTTGCVRIGSNFNDVTSLIQTTILYNQFNKSADYKLTDILNVTTKKFKRSVGKTYNLTYGISFSSDIVAGFHASISTVGCNKIRTIGYWNDPNRWVSKSVPVSSDNVVFPVNSGVVMLVNDISLKSITMNDGLLYSYKTGCPDGWSIDPIGTTVRKCYKLFTNSSSFHDAESTCENSGYGSIDAHLVEISNYNELNTVRGLCRGAMNDAVVNEGCWIGLKDKLGDGHYNWLEPNGLLRTSFRNWRRPEWNNKTVSDGIRTPGELCVHIVGWREDPLIEEQGSWNDMGCSIKKPFICQTFAKTTRYQITVTQISVNNGAMEGGILSLTAASTINNLSVRRSASLLLLGGSSTISNITLTDGSSLSINLPASVEFTTSAIVGEPSYPIGLQPQFKATGNIATANGLSLYQVQINARSLISSGVSIGANSNILFNQGGDMSAATINTASLTSTFTLGGYASRLVAYDAFDIQLSHRGQVVGEFLNSTEPSLLENSKAVGVYRLSVVGTGDVTRCIDYHASAAELEAILKQLYSIRERGGVTVRRYGDGNDPLFSFGYTHRVEIDASTTSNFAAGPLTISLKCVGIVNCYCAQTKVAMVDARGQSECPAGTYSSGVDNSKCVINPTIAVTRISTLSYTRTNGLGKLSLSGGVHRLPPLSNIPITCSAGSGIVAADVISWTSFSATVVGRFVITGTGWSCWDSALVLFLPPWAEGRGLLSVLDNTPSFSMTVSTFRIYDQASVLTASPNSRITCQTGTWGGGIIGGLSTMFITNTITAQSANNKALKYGITLFINSTANFVWNKGNISFSDGAYMIVEGAMEVKTVGPMQYFGQAQLLQTNNTNSTILEQQSGIQWHGYYDNTLPAELRYGWYRNPLCGAICLRTSQVYIRKSAKVTFDDNSNCTFAVPVNLIGTNIMTVGDSSFINLQSGGTLGNNVLVNVKQGVTITLSGGSMNMENTCKIKGEGKLIVAAGAHYCASVIDLAITISGGALIWPLENGQGLSITFNGGLLINKTGKLQVQPFNTSIIVKKFVTFQDQSYLQFPEIGSAAQPSNFDRQDAPDTSPRGKLVALDEFRFQSGKLSGKADFISNKTMYIETDSDKTMDMQARIINKGHLELTGDIFMANGADILNLGTVQIIGETALGYNSGIFFKGTIIPVTNGGDVFALNYHSYDADEGGLDYSQYVSLRTLIVSRAPQNWKKEDQGTINYQ